jgi:hypothetical protein
LGGKTPLREPGQGGVKLFRIRNAVADILRQNCGKQLGHVHCDLKKTDQ